MLPIIPTSVRSVRCGSDLTVERPEVSSIGGSKMNVFRFVVCEETGVSTCSSKRVIVDVQTIPTKMQVNYKHSYYELQSTVTKTGG